ncbi:restriction endonuclease subunit S [Ruminococcus sp. KGMB03662]|nr:restriction endonuclease subunit S [Ruminococcus sp. KGMB03662]
MTKLEQLIKELCPNGVKYVAIKDYFTRLKGTPITAGKMKEIDSPDGEIRIFAGGKTVINAHEKDIPNANITRVPAVLVQSRGVIDFIYYEKPFTFKNEMWAYTAENKITVKYLYYFLQNNTQHFRDSASGMGSLPQISLHVTEDFKIPVPPLEVQAEIVKILDEYSTSVTALQQELEKELTARKKQYEYYRDLLLDFGVHGGATSECKWRTLESFADVRDGTHDSPKPSDYGYPLVTSKNISGGNLDLTSCYLINENDYNSINQRSKVDITDVLVSMIGTIGETIIVTSEPNYAIKNIGLVKTGNLLTSKYIKYYISSSYGQRYIQENIKGTAPRYLSLTALRKFSIPVPPIEEQERIVSILDRFDKLCNDISEGLPAEIEARRKQYEYYRDKLLSFKEQ